MDSFDVDPFALLASLSTHDQPAEMVDATPVSDQELYQGTEPVTASDPHAEIAAQAIAAPDLTAQALLALHARLSIIEEFLRRNGHL